MKQTFTNVCCYHWSVNGEPKHVILNTLNIMLIRQSLIRDCCSSFFLFRGGCQLRRPSFSVAQDTANDKWMWSLAFPTTAKCVLNASRACSHLYSWLSACERITEEVRRYQMWKASKSGTSGFSLLKWWSFPFYTPFRWETPLLHSCMRLSWPYFTLRLAGTLKDFPPSIYTVSLSHTSALPRPWHNWRDRLFMIF